MSSDPKQFLQLQNKIVSFTFSNLGVHCFFVDKEIPEGKNKRKKLAYGWLVGWWNPRP